MAPGLLTPLYLIQAMVSDEQDADSIQNTWVVGVCVPCVLN